MNMDHTLMVSRGSESWHFASMLGLVDMSGTWDPRERALRARRVQTRCKEKKRQIHNLETFFKCRSRGIWWGWRKRETHLIIFIFIFMLTHSNGCKSYETRGWTHVREMFLPLHAHSNGF